MPILSRSLSVILLFTVIMFFSFGCQKNSSAFKVSPLETQEPQTAQMPDPAQGSSQELGNSFIVREIIQTEKYTYLRVDENSVKTEPKKDIWVASSLTSPKVGDVVSFDSMMAMENFESKSLKKTFAQIYFVQSTQILSADTQNPEVSKNDHTQVQSAATIDLKNLKKADYTVAEILKNKESLASKKKVIKLRGKVVKYNEAIMGKNWIHIQDGSDLSGKNDLTITTQTKAQVGQTVLIEGLLSVDRDFGYGYRYEALLEDAKVTIE